MKITIDMMMTKDATICYEREQFERLWGSNESLTLTEITELDIPAADKIWVVTRFLSNRSNRLFAADCAERCAVKISDKNLKQCAVKLIDKIRQAANGKITVDELAADSAADMAAYWAADRAAEQQWQIERIRHYIKQVKK